LQYKYRSKSTRQSSVEIAVILLAIQTQCLYELTRNSHDNNHYHDSMDNIS